MARAIIDIKKEMTGQWMASASVQSAYGFPEGASFEDVFSKVSLESIFFYIVAVCQWTLEKLFDSHKTEVAEIISTLKPHTPRWYAARAKEFQYGDNLMEDSDAYDNTGQTQEEIDGKKIVAYSAVVEQNGGLLIKVARNAGDDLAPLSDGELAAFTDYVGRVKDAGVVVEVLSREADSLKLGLEIYYNPLVLNSKGERIDGTSASPVEDAIRSYLKNTPFNGMLVLAYLTDALQGVEGVVIPHIESAQCRYGEINWESIRVKYQPFSGYTRLAGLEVTYIPQTEIL